MTDAHNLYSTDNPPPKVLQGYKVRDTVIPTLYAVSIALQFNIFYPDLIDKSKAPGFKIIKEPGNDETVLLHFFAGPPYEDIAFRIVNREWEFSHKRFALIYSSMSAITLTLTQRFPKQL